MQETWIQSLIQENALEKEMATHSSILAQKIPMDRGTYRITVQGVSKNQTWLKAWTTTTTPCLNPIYPPKPTLAFTVSDTAYASSQGLLVPLAAESPDNAASLAKGQPAQKSHFLSFQKLFIPK